MKKLLMAAAALVAFALSGIANAADLALPPAPPLIVPAPVLSWTGPYVGLNGGGGWGTTDHTFTGVAAGLSASTGNFKITGGLAGGTWGYNYQMAPGCSAPRATSTGRTSGARSPLRCPAS